VLPASHLLISKITHSGAKGWWLVGLKFNAAAETAQTEKLNAFIYYLLVFAGVLG